MLLKIFICAYEALIKYVNQKNETRQSGYTQNTLCIINALYLLRWCGKYRQGQLNRETFSQYSLNMEIFYQLFFWKLSSQWRVTTFDCEENRIGSPWANHCPKLPTIYKKEKKICKNKCFNPWSSASICRDGSKRVMPTIGD